MSDTSVDASGLTLPEYDDPEATRPHEELAPMSAPPSTRAAVPRSEARVDPLVEVWAWLADEFEDRAAADPSGLLQLTEVLALSGHMDAARDTARAAFERAPSRLAIARQFRVLAPPAERASSAYAEALAASSDAARLHAFVHSWLAAHLSGSPRPLAIADMPLASWLGACASGVADAEAIADVVLAADYVAQMQMGGWETSYPAASIIAAGLPRDPQKVSAGFERFLAACASSQELSAALPWLRRWAKIPTDGTGVSSNANTDQPVLAALLSLQDGGENALAQWLRAQEFGTANGDSEHDTDGVRSLPQADAERLLQTVLSPTLPAVARKVETLISPTDERIAQLAESPALSAFDRTQLEALLEQRRVLALPEDARKTLVLKALARVRQFPAVAALSPLLDALQAQDASTGDNRASTLAGPGSWVAPSARSWGEQANLLAAQDPANSAAAYVARLFSDQPLLPADETTRQLYESLLSEQGAAPMGFEPTAIEALAAEWVKLERAQNGTDAQRRDWSERAHQLCPDSPWVQRYAEEIARMDGNDLYALLVPRDEIAQAESRGDTAEALRLTLERMPAAQTLAGQRALYIDLARFYEALGDIEKLELCRLEVAKRSAAHD